MNENSTSKKEEIVNILTHSFGIILSIIAIFILILKAVFSGSIWHIISYPIYGFTLFILYFSSTLYHFISFKPIKRIFHKLDHIAIYWLIAGTYTPFCLITLQGWIGWSLLTFIWLMAISGTIVKSISVDNFVILSTIIYVIMGWIVILAIKPLYYTINTESFIYLVIGGVIYTSGVYFFLKENIIYNHGIWHIFVLWGSFFHFLSIINL